MILPCTHCVLPENMESVAVPLNQTPRVIPEVPPPIPVHDPGLLALFLLLSHDFYPSYQQFSSGLPQWSHDQPSYCPLHSSICFEYSIQCEPLHHTSNDWTHAMLEPQAHLPLRIKIKILNVTASASKRTSQPRCTDTIVQVVHY